MVTCLTSSKRGLGCYHPFGLLGLLGAAHSGPCFSCTEFTAQYCLNLYVSAGNVVGATSARAHAGLLVVICPPAGLHGHPRYSRQRSSLCVAETGRGIEEDKDHASFMAAKWQAGRPLIP